MQVWILVSLTTEQS